MQRVGLYMGIEMFSIRYKHNLLHWLHDKPHNTHSGRNCFPEFQVNIWNLRLAFTTICHDTFFLTSQTVAPRAKLIVLYSATVCLWYVHKEINFVPLQLFYARECLGYRESISATLNVCQYYFFHRNLRRTGWKHLLELGSWYLCLKISKVSLLLNIFIGTGCFWGFHLVL